MKNRKSVSEYLRKFRYPIKVYAINKTTVIYMQFKCRGMQAIHSKQRSGWSV